MSSIMLPASEGCEHTNYAFMKHEVKLLCIQVM